MGGSCPVCLHSLAIYWGLELFRRLPCFVTACFKESVQSSCWPNDSEHKEFFKWMTCGSHCCRSNWFMMDLEVWGFSGPPAGSLTALILPFEASLRCRRSSFPLINQTESNKPSLLLPVNTDSETAVVNVTYASREHARQWVTSSVFHSNLCHFFAVTRVLVLGTVVKNLMWKNTATVWQK